MPAPRTHLLMVAMLWLAVACSPSEVSFKRDIEPILQKNCVVCHAQGSAGHSASGFSVATYQDVMKGTKYGSVINPGSSISSTLVQLIQHKADASINMPKRYTVFVQNHQEHAVPSMDARSLSDSDIDLIVRWIDQGAKNN